MTDVKLEKCPSCGLDGGLGAAPARLSFCGDERCSCAADACPRCGFSDPGGRVADRLGEAVRLLRKWRGMFLPDTQALAALYFEVDALLARLTPDAEES